MKRLVEYIWLDGAKPTQKLRCKTRVIECKGFFDDDTDHYPDWSFDGSSTYQSDGNSSDLVLSPVRIVKDPIRGGNNTLALCEVLNCDGTPHRTNTRAKLRNALDNGGSTYEPWIGFEQEYTLFDGQSPLGWPNRGYPAPQGPFYCGVGADEVAGRKLVEAHTRACLEADLMLFGINSEVMLGQWEFQVGYRGIGGETADPLTVSDHLWLARWLLYRLGEQFGISATLDQKPVRGDWNGAGNHTNFSTKFTRNENSGPGAIKEAIEKLKAEHNSHVKEYGVGLEERLTGKHETCSVNTFKSGVSDRTASIRIPGQVAKKGYGYFEDRRPGANCDPYLVSIKLIETVCT